MPNLSNAVAILERDERLPSAPMLETLLTALGVPAAEQPEWLMTAFQDGSLLRTGGDRAGYLTARDQLRALRKENRLLRAEAERWQHAAAHWRRRYRTLTASTLKRLMGGSDVA